MPLYIRKFPYILMKTKKKSDCLSIEVIVKISDKVDAYIDKNYNKMIKRGRIKDKTNSDVA